MGAQPYWYFVPHEPDLQAALDKLRQREFQAGRYSPAMDLLDFEDPTFMTRSPGPAHASIDEAFEAGSASGDGTGSILDIARVGTVAAFGVVTPWPRSVLEGVIGTLEPTRDEVEAALPELFEPMDRGEAHYLVVYDQGKPAEILFAGYSFD